MTRGVSQAKSSQRVNDTDEEAEIFARSPIDCSEACRLDYNPPDENPPDTLRPFLDTSILKGGQELFSDLWRDNIYLQQQLEKTQAECSDLALEVRMHKAKDIPNALASQKQIDYYKTLLGKYHYLQKGKGDIQFPADLEQIRCQFERLKSQCHGISRNYDYVYPTGSIFSDTRLEDVKNLLHAAFGGDESLSSAYLTLSTLEERFPIHLMIHCFIGTAIKEWVLKPPMRCVAMLETPLLKAYREHIMVIGKPRRS
jgi:hypothetical protein